MVWFGFGQERVQTVLCTPCSCSTKWSRWALPPSRGTQTWSFAVTGLREIILELLPLDGMDSLEEVAEEGGDALSLGPRSVMTEVVYVLPACWSCMSTMKNSCSLFLVDLQWVTPVMIQEVAKQSSRKA